MNLHNMAKLGAQIRIKELRAEIVEIQKFMANGQMKPKTHHTNGKKLHWTQRPENKKRMSKIMRKMWAAKQGK